LYITNKASLDHDFDTAWLRKMEILFGKTLLTEIDKNRKLLNLRGIMIDITKTKERNRIK
jgi:hypothetical protein